MANICLIRGFRLTTLFIELKQPQLFFTTLKAMSGPFLSMLTSLFIVFFVYVQIGSYWFAAKVNIYSTSDYVIPQLYYLLNFNDFGSGMITMFHIMVVNNWFVTCKMYEDIVGVDHYWEPRFFFLSFWVIVVLVVLNIVVSIVIDIYDSVHEEVDLFFKRTHCAQ